MSDESNENNEQEKVNEPEQESTEAVEETVVENKEETVEESTPVEEKVEEPTETEATVEEPVAEEAVETKEEAEPAEESKSTMEEAPEIVDETEKEFLASVKEDVEEAKKEKAEKKAEEEKEKAEAEEASDKEDDEHSVSTRIFALRTTANREDQVMDFLGSNITKKKLGVYSIIRPHGMRGYIFMEADKRIEAEQAAFNVPYARGVLANEIQYKEIEHMLEQVKKDVNIQKNDIVELISGPFKREKAKVSRIDKTKEEVVVELLEAAVPIPITVRLDAVKVIRRDTEDSEEGEEGEE
jgi:transcription termination/antitermination protein NusG